MIVGLGCYFSSSDRMSRGLDTLFGSQLPKLPSRIGRMEHLAGVGSAMWRFKTDVHARFLERMRAPGRAGEPQSTGGEQRRCCQGQMFCFHCFLGFDSSFKFTFAMALCEDFWELAFDLERTREILVRSARQRE